MAATAILNLSTRCWEKPETLSAKTQEPCTKVDKGDTVLLAITWEYHDTLHAHVFVLHRLRI